MAETAKQPIGEWVSALGAKKPTPGGGAAGSFPCGIRALFRAGQLGSQSQPRSRLLTSQPRFQLLLSAQLRRLLARWPRFTQPARKTR
jgi:hypothetical protein